MSGLFFNKVAGAFLASTLGILVINRFAGVVVHPDIPDPEHFAYKIETGETAAPVEAEPIPFPSPSWLAAQDADKGAKVFKKCKSCHTAEADGKNGTGPWLYNVVGRPKASEAGFTYSSAMSSKGGNWTMEDLDRFLTKPKDFVPGTKMSFNGLKKETDRAAVISYLREHAENPVPALAAILPDVQPSTEDVPVVEDQTMDPTVETPANDEKTGTEGEE